jgi:hypothetical protein
VLSLAYRCLEENFGGEFYDDYDEI